MENGDHYRHLADLASYGQAQQSLGNLFADQKTWARKAILNIAASGRFSSDRTIAGCAKKIWYVKPSPIEWLRYYATAATKNAKRESARDDVSSLHECIAVKTTATSTATFSESFSSRVANG